MSRYVFNLKTEEIRQRAIDALYMAPLGFIVTIKEASRTNEQNNLMWPLLDDIARQTLYHGQRLHTEDWKYLFMDQLSREHRLVPSLDGDGIVDLGKRSSRLTKAQFSDLIELIYAYGAKHGVRFSEKRAA